MGAFEILAGIGAIICGIGAIKEGVSKRFENSYAAILEDFANDDYDYGYDYDEAEGEYGDY